MISPKLSCAISRPSANEESLSSSVPRSGSKDVALDSRKQESDKYESGPVAATEPRFIAKVGSH